jgi:hypothetical protein
MIGRHPLVLYVIVLVILLVWKNGNGYGDESDDILRRFLAEAPIGWRKLEGLSVKTVARATHTVTPSKPNTPVNVEEILLTSKRLPGYLSIELDNARGYHVFCKNEQYFFQVNRKNDTANNWLLDYVGGVDSSTDGLPDYTYKIIYMKYIYHVLPATTFTCYENPRLIELINNPSFKLEHGKMVGKQVQIDISYKEKKQGKEETRAGRIIFDPDLYWAVAEYSINIGTASQTWKNTFFDNPVNKSCPVKSWISIVKSSTGEAKWEGVVELIEELNAPSKDFYLTAYNLPEPKRFVPTDQTQTRSILFLAGIILCAILAFLFRRFARKKT